LEKRYSTSKKIILLALIFWVIGCLLWINYASSQSLLNAALAKAKELFEKRQALREFIMGFGGLAPVVFILLQAGQVILSPIPGEATGFIGGFIFGLPSFFYSTIGLSLGSIGAFFIARYFRRFVRPWIEQSEYYRRFEALLEHQGLFITFLLFVFPGFPKDFLCYFLGLSSMPWEVFFIICTVGRMPGTLMLTLQGAELFEGRFDRLAIVFFLTIIFLIPMYLKRESI